MNKLTTLQKVLVTIGVCGLALTCVAVGIGPESTFTQTLKTNTTAVAWRNALGVTNSGSADTNTYVATLEGNSTNQHHYGSPDFLGYATFALGFEVGLSGALDFFTNASITLDGKDLEIRPANNTSMDRVIIGGTSGDNIILGTNGGIFARGITNAGFLYGNGALISNASGGVALTAQTTNTANVQEWKNNAGDVLGLMSYIGWLQGRSVRADASTFSSAVEALYSRGDTNQSNIATFRRGTDAVELSYIDADGAFNGPMGNITGANGTNTFTNTLQGTTIKLAGTNFAWFMTAKSNALLIGFTSPESFSFGTNGINTNYGYLKATLLTEVSGIKTAHYTVTTNDSTIRCNSTASNIVMTLPTTAVVGQSFTFVNLDDGSFSAVVTNTVGYVLGQASPDTGTSFPVSHGAGSYTSVTVEKIDSTNYFITKLGYLVP